MSKSKKTEPQGMTRDDDISGLFSRLGLASADDGYRDFSRERLRTVVAPAAEAARVEAGAEASPVPASPTKPGRPAAAAPVRQGRLLRELFGKLLEAGDAADIDRSASPLRKLRAPN